jgi:predicted nucleic acid-binding protein
VTFDDLPDGSPVFIDANTFVYRYGTDPLLSGPCTRLIERAERGDVTAFTTTQVLGDVAHRLMISEAAVVASRSSVGMLRYLKAHPNFVQQLTQFRQSVEDLMKGPLQILSIAPAQVSAAMAASQQHGLLHNDALIVAVMQAHSLTNLASHDADFDRVPGLNRFAPA